MDTSFGLMHMWQQGDAVSRTVALFLLFMSIATWIVIAVKAFSLYLLKKKAKAAEGFWHAQNFESALKCLGSDNQSPWRMLAIEGREAVEHHQNSKQQLHDSLDLSDWVTRILRNSLDVISERMSSGLALLASIGSTAPFVGLFGTVWGIYHALLSLSGGGATSIDKVAGPIGEALIMTACGLAVAIPAVLGYNALVRANKGMNHKLRHFAHDLHAYLITGARVVSAEEAGKRKHYYHHAHHAHHAHHGQQKHAEKVTQAEAA